MSVRIAGHYKTSIDVDGQLLKLRIRRLNREQWIDFASELARKEQVMRGRQLLLERKAGEEVLTDEDVIAKRFMELSADERDARAVAERDEAQRGSDFALEAISAYVSTDGPEELYDDDRGVSVTEGKDIVALFGQRHDILAALLAEIFIQNQMSEDQKKTLRLLRVSTPGLNGKSMGPGGRPAPTAESVVAETSAAAEAAMGSPEPSPSGSTDPSS